MPFQYKLVLCRLINQLFKYEKQRRQKGKRRQRGDYDTLHQNDANIKTNPHRHKEQCKKSGDSSQCTCGNRLYYILYRRSHCLFGGNIIFFCLAVAVQKNDAVIYGQRKLKDCGNRIGYIGYFTEDGVRSHIDENSNARSNK